MKAKLPVDINVSDLFEEGGMDIVDTMTDILKFQQQGAIDLTRLVLEHCKGQEITKDYVFEVFEEAMEILKSQMNKYAD